MSYWVNAGLLTTDVKIDGELALNRLPAGIGFSVFTIEPRRLYFLPALGHGLHAADCITELLSTGLIKHTRKNSCKCTSAAYILQRLNTAVFQVPQEIGRNSRVLAGYLFLSPLKTITAEELFEGKGQADTFRLFYCLTDPVLSMSFITRKKLTKQPASLTYSQDCWPVLMPNLLEHPSGLSPSLVPVCGMSTGTDERQCKMY